MEDFCIRLAGIPVRIRCRYLENRVFLQDYWTEEAPLFTVEPTAEDLEKIQRDINLLEKGTNRRKEVFLENNALHAMLAEGLAERHVLLMHGSALSMDGSGYIFTAPSGEGKSTHARLWRQVFGDRVQMINDDKPMIRTDEMRVYGTPWNGKHCLGRNISAPLKAIIWLKRGKENLIEPVSKINAFPLLMQQAFQSENAATMKQIIGMEKKMAECIRFYRMRCTATPNAARTAWKGIVQGPGSDADE